MRHLVSQDLANIANSRGTFDYNGRWNRIDYNRLDQTFGISGAEKMGSGYITSANMPAIVNSFCQLVGMPGTTLDVFLIIDQKTVNTTLAPRLETGKITGINFPDLPDSRWITMHNYL